MGIKAKLLLAFICLFLLFGGISSALLSHRVAASYQHIEVNQAVDDMDRIVGLLEVELESLTTLTSDWGDWDDMYRYVVDHDPRFYDANLQNNAFRNTHNGLVAIFDADGHAVELTSIDPATAIWTDYSELVKPDNPYHAFLTRREAPSPAGCGIVRVWEGLMLVCRWPIRTSQHAGPIRGTVVMGRLLDKPLLDEMRHRAKLDFTLDQHAAADRNDPVLSLHKLDSRLGIRPVQYHQEGERFILHWPVYDLLGRPQAELRLPWPRTVTALGQRVVDQTMQQLGILAGLIALGLVAAGHLLLVRPLTHLEDQLRTIRQKHAWGTRVSAGQHDEIGSLGGHINDLLTLIETQIGTLEKLSLTDPLTGTANRRAFDNLLAREVLHHHRSGSPLCLLLVDVDHFKLYNDTYGHVAGDQVLITVAECLQAAAQRGTDLVARIGGEEFAALLPETSVEGARKVAEAMRQNLAERALPHAASPTSDRVTLSIGIALLGEDDDPASLFQRADIGLYGAKGTGRDRAVFKVDRGQNAG